jgi:hypothetical protein
MLVLGNNDALSRIIAILALAMVAVGMAQGSGHIPTTVSRYPTILVLQFESVQMQPLLPCGPGCQTLEATVRIGPILKDAKSLNVAPGQYVVTIRQALPSVGVPLYPSWSNRNVEAGQQYILFTESTEDIAAIVDHPASVESLTDDPNAIDDIEINLRAEVLPVVEQCRAVADALSKSQHHGRFLAEYTAALLAVASDGDTMPIVEALEAGGADAFTDRGKAGLLTWLFFKTRTANFASENSIRTLAGLTLRYLAQVPFPGRGLHIERDILQNELPYLRGDERGQLWLRQVVLPDTVLRQLRSKAVQFSVDEHLSPESRVEARELLQLVPMR